MSKKAQYKAKTVDLSSSSDDDIPLSYFFNRAIQLNSVEEDADLTYDPNKEADINSTDSELEDLLDDNTKTKLKEDKKIKQLWDQTVKRIQKKKNFPKPTVPRKCRKSLKKRTNKKGKETSELEKSREDIIQQLIIIGSHFTRPGCLYRIV